MRLFKRKGSPNWWATWNDQKGRRQRKSTGVKDKSLAQTLVAKWQQESFMEQHFGTIRMPFVDDARDEHFELHEIETFLAWVSTHNRHAYTYS